MIHHLALCIGLTAQLPSMVLASPKLHHHSHYEVDRSLLEKGYPAYKSFKGFMHAGLIPAVSLVEENGNSKEDVNDYSEYFFWLFRPDVDDSDVKGKPESFRDDTLLIWLNGKYRHQELAQCKSLQKHSHSQFAFFYRKPNRIQVDQDVVLWLVQ